MPIWKSPFGAQTYWLPAIAVLGGMGLLILLVVCANVANLVLVRGVSRRGELSVRLALGASRSRLLRLLLVENLVLALPGALGGVALASVLLPFLSSGAAANAPSRVYLDTSIDGYVLTFAIAVACACAIVFGFVPALRASRVEFTAALNDLSPRMAARGRDYARCWSCPRSPSRWCCWLRQASCCAAIPPRHRPDGGFESANVTSIAIDLQTAGYDGTRGPVAITRLLDAFASEPSFEHATLALNVPMSLVDNGSRVTTIEGYAPRSDEDMLFLYNVVAPDYFGTLRIPLLAGRDFARTDDAGAQAAVIVNETLARRFWQTPENAVGKRLRSGTMSGATSSAWRAISSTHACRRGRARSSTTRSCRPMCPASPFMRAPAAISTTRCAAFAITCRPLDPTIPITRSTTLTEQTRVALSVYGLAAGALTMFGVMTIVLAAIGIYGLVAYTVQQSTQEIGIRMAVGARRIDVVWDFLKRGTRLAIMGAAIGLVLAATASGAIRSLLYGVSTRDAVSFGGGTIVVMTIALLASLIPAWRASRTDPLKALRHQ